MQSPAHSDDRSDYWHLPRPLPIEDSIAIEGSESPYVNVIAVRSEDKDSEAIKKLVEVLRSEPIQEFILEEWGGAVVPVSE